MSGDDSPASQIVRFGMGLRSEGSRTFWDDFIRVCNNSDGMAQLLGVRPDQVAQWSSRVLKIIDQVEYEDSNSDKKNVLNTGNFNIGN